jgi:hypothetical protein
MKFDTSIFRNSVVKIQVYGNLTIITATLHEDLSTFMISRLIIRMTNVSDKSCKKNQNTPFIFIPLFQKLTIYKI